MYINPNLKHSLEAIDAFYAYRLADPDQLCRTAQTIQLAELAHKARALREQMTRLEENLGYKFNPNQPRVPAGSPDGGQWTSGGGGGGNDNSDSLDVFGVNDAFSGLQDALGSLGDLFSSGGNSGDDGFLLPSRLVMDDAGNISELPDAPRISAPASWARAETFDKHFNDHADDFGARSKTEYARMANDFYLRGMSEKLPAIQTQEGWVKIYDPKTNSFGTYDSQGKTETFFKPTSKNYFQRQIIRVLLRGGRIIEPLPIEGPIVPEILIP